MEMSRILPKLMCIMTQIQDVIGKWIMKKHQFIISGSLISTVKVIYVKIRSDGAKSGKFVFCYFDQLTYKILQPNLQN